MVAVVRVLSPLHPHVLLRKACAKRGGPPRRHPPSHVVPGSRGGVLRPRWSRVRAGSPVRCIAAGRRASFGEPAVAGAPAALPQEELAVVDCEAVTSPLGARARYALGQVLHAASGKWSTEPSVTAATTSLGHVTVHPAKRRAIPRCPQITSRLMRRSPSELSPAPPATAGGTAGAPRVLRRLCVARRGGAAVTGPARRSAEALSLTGSPL